MLKTDEPPASAKPSEKRSASRLTRGEWGLLLVLAAVQFTHVLDFVIVMPLGPVFQESLHLNAERFGWMVSAYGFSASVSGLLAAWFLDRFDRKKALLVLYVGFTLGTLLCAVAPGYLVLVLGRIVAGGFAGVMGASVLAIIGDVMPESRRAQAMGVIMSSFSVASIVGVPAGLFLANHTDWRFPFAVLVGICLMVLPFAMRLLPPLRGHLERGPVRTVNPLAVLLHPIHLRAYALTSALVLGTFTVVPYLSLYLVNNVGRRNDELPYVYLFGGVATLLTMTPIGRIADRHGKLRTFRVIAILTLVPLLALTNLPPGPLAVTLLTTTLFMVATSARWVPAMALITSSAAPRQRGSFMSVNSSVQQMAMGLGSVIAAAILGGAGEGGEPLRHFDLVGLVGAAAMVASILLAGRLRPGAEPVPVTPAVESSPC